MLSRVVVVVCLAVVLFSTSALAQSVVSHPASDVTPGAFATGDYRFPNGFVYVGSGNAGFFGDANRMALVAPDGSVKLSAYNDHLEVAGALRFADGTSMSTAAAQLWTQSGANAYYSNGAVSIGTATPYSTNSLLTIASTNDPELTLQKTGIRAFGLRVVTGGEFDHALAIRDSSDDKEITRFVRGGNVGIGTASPTQRLDVNGSTILSGTDPRIYLYAPDLNYYVGRTSTNVELSSSGNIALYANSGTISFDTVGVPRMRIINNGNVGIGTATPGSRLDVSGGNIRLSGVGDQELQLQSGVGYWQLIPRTSGSSNRLDIRESSTGNVAMTFLTGGSVGIGTASPGRKLEVKAGDDDGIITTYSGTGGGSVFMTGCRAGWGCLPSIRFFPASGTSFEIMGGSNQLAIISSYGATPFAVQDVGGQNYKVCINGDCRASWPSAPTWHLIGTTTVAGTGYTAVDVPSACTLTVCQGFVGSTYSGTNTYNEAFTIRHYSGNKWGSAYYGNGANSAGGTNGDTNSDTIAVVGGIGTCYIYDDYSGVETSSTQWAISDNRADTSCELWMLY